MGRLDAPRRNAVGAIFAVTLAACASTPVPTDETAPVPADRIVDSRYLAAAPGTGEVSIKRDGGILGAACAIHVAIDGKVTVALRRSERIVLHLPAGSHIIGASGGGLCGLGNGEPEAKADVVEDGRIGYRVGHSSTGDFAIFPTSF